MRVLRGTLTFVLGMIIGIILFVIAIGGAVMLIGTSVTVGELQGNFTEEDVISPDSQLYSQTILEAIQSVISDVQAMDSLTMRTLYEHYGIELLNGISGIDFTSKEFYDTNLKALIDDMSIVVNSFTLQDISGLAGVDFKEYNLPVLTDNLSNNIQTALDNILSSLNGDLSIRSISANFGIDLGVEDNALIKTLQDVALSTFGEVINAITLNTLLDVDSDLFIPQNGNIVYKSVDAYVEVSKEDLALKGDYRPAKGVETYYAGATQNDETWTMIENELRFVQKEDADGNIEYVVDNSCYKDDFDANETDKTFYRHVQYEQADGKNLDNLYVETYYNRIATINGNNITLRSAGFTAVKDLKGIDWTNISAGMSGVTFNATADNALYYLLDDEITKDSLLRTLAEDESAKGNAYIRVKVGESEQVLQIVAPMTVSELQKADDLLGSLTVGNVVDTEAEDTASVLKALKDCKLTEIGNEINDLPLEDLMGIDDDSSQIMQAIRNHGCTLNNINEKIDTFTIGEVIAVKYDVYEKADVEHVGHYVQEIITVPFNKFVHNEDNAYENGQGEMVIDVIKYRLERESDGDAQRYYLSEEGDALAIQMMALRGYTLKNIGSELNNMGFDELVRITPESSLIMKSLAKHNATLDNIGGMIDTLLIDEVIEINDSSATIMKSLAKRECTISELGNVAGSLTLAETTEIVFDKYTEAPEGQHGKYVKVVDKDRYVLYDESNPNFVGAQRYTKTTDDEGKAVYSEDENGKYTHPFYFTLYNPAEHGADCTTYNIVAKDENAPQSSSKVLQRLAYCSIDKFSEEFDNLSLGDVLDIDIDILAQDTTSEADKSYFYYDRTDKLYMRQEGADLKNVDKEYQNFRVVEDGTSSSVLKRLAYVPIDNLSSAMEKVMKDMMLSELVDIYNESAVSIRTDDNTPINQNDMFIVKPFGEDDKGEYTFVYNTAGKYIQRPYGFYQLSDEELADIKTGDASYNYAKIIATEDITNPQSLTYAIGTGNIYYKDGENYVYNLALCTYVGMQGKFDKLYTRVSGTDVTIPTYSKDNIQLSEKSVASLYVLFNGVYQAYDASNLAHLGLDIYELRVGTCYVPITTPDDGSNTYKYQEGQNTYSKQYCETIYVQDAGGEYAYIGGQFVKPESGEHIRYNAVTGYLATTNECYCYSEGRYSQPLDHILYRVAVGGEGNHQKSEKVLHTLSDSTIGGINDKIKEAKVGDLLEIESGSLFEDFADSKLSDISADLQNSIKNWTVGELAQKANITSIDPKVKAALEGVTLDNFFKSLTYSASAGIVVDLEKAYGYGGNTNQ